MSHWYIDDSAETEVRIVGYMRWWHRVWYFLTGRWRMAFSKHPVVTFTPKRADIGV